MSKKIIQFSTTQCTRCQVIKSKLEKELKDSPIEYEYISLANPTKVVTRENVQLYWEEVYENFKKYSEKYQTRLFTGLPSFLIIDNDVATPVLTEQVFNFINQNK